jgi:hypothetical protein
MREPIEVLESTLADECRQVAEERFDVHSLVGPLQRNHGLAGPYVWPPLGRRHECDELLAEQ